MSDSDSLDVSPDSSFDNVPVRLAMIVAVSENGAIGMDNKLPWRLREDLRRFKRLTMGHPMIMGRATWESIGRPLPGRRSIVVSRNAGYRAKGAEVVSSLESAVRLASKGRASAEAPEVFVIGGASLYSAALENVLDLHLTRVMSQVAGDVFFPEVNFSEWRVLSAESLAADEHNDHATRYFHLRRLVAP